MIQNQGKHDSLHWKKIGLKEVQQFLFLCLVNNLNERVPLKSVLKLQEKLDFWKIVFCFALGFSSLVVFYFSQRRILEKTKLYDKIIRWRTSESICSAETCTCFMKYLLHRIISEGRLLSGHNPNFIDTSSSVIFHGNDSSNNWNLYFLIWIFSFYFHTPDNHALLL